MLKKYQVHNNSAFFVRFSCICAKKRLFEMRANYVYSFFFIIFIFFKSREFFFRKHINWAQSEMIILLLTLLFFYFSFLILPYMNYDLLKLSMYSSHDKSHKKTNTIFYFFSQSLPSKEKYLYSYLYFFINKFIFNKCYQCY